MRPRDKKLLAALLAGLVLMACHTPLPGAPTATANALAATSNGEATQTPFPRPRLPGQTKVEQFESGGVSRTYWAYIPSHYSAGTSTPMVINFHGLGGNAPVEEGLSGMSPKAEAEGFIAVYPNGVDGAWRDVPGSPDVQFTRDLIAQLEGMYSIDPKRIYVTGISNGGGMTNRVGCDLTDVVAAIGPVEGAYNLWKMCKPSRPMPVVAFHGLADKLVPYAGVGDGNIAPPIHDWAAAWASRRCMCGKA